MSGIASAASTIPGRVATFWSCSSERSVRIASSSSWSANTRAGTRMSSRALAGISHRVSSMRSGAGAGPRSDIEHDVPAPAVAVTPKLEVVVRHGLDEVARLVQAPDDHARDRVLADDEVPHVVRHQAVGLRQEDELGQPLRQQRAAVGGLRLDRALGPRTGRRLVVLEELAQGMDGLHEHARLAAGVDLELQLGGVLDPAVSGLHGAVRGLAAPRAACKRYAADAPETRSAAAIGSSGSCSAPSRSAIAALAPRPPTHVLRPAAIAASCSATPTSGSARAAAITISSASSSAETSAIALAGVSAPR